MGMSMLSSSELNFISTRKLVCVCVWGGGGGDLDFATFLKECQGHPNCYENEWITIKGGV